MNVFKTAKWIWLRSMGEKDEYGEFVASFDAAVAPTVCRISCDGDYTLFVNGEYVSSNQYGDFEHYKIYDEVDVTPYLRTERNEMRVLVWHTGVDLPRYINAQAGVIFEMVQGADVLLESNETILCRQSPTYRNGYCKAITGQLGFSFFYDATKEGEGEWIPATPVNKQCQLYPRPIPKQQVLPRKAVTVLKNEGTYYLIDLGEETVGLPTLEFKSDTVQTILVAWGEDLQEDGHVRRQIMGRDFSFEYRARAGKNGYTNYMLRLGGRYLELYAEDPITLDYLGVRPQIYPVQERKTMLDTPMDQRIYDLCVRTLRLSMMEHYVDTPWREQCLYVFDSRNQMLCGYRAFENGNADYARANLLLFGKDRREDGLLSICSPCGMDLTIPSFSLYYFMAVREYLDFTGDTSLIREIYPKLLSIMGAFMKNRRDGLVVRFGASNHWNFYDWSRYLEGRLMGVDEEIPDLVLNCLFITALENLRAVARKADLPFDYDDVLEETRRCTRETFYEEGEGAYALTQGGAEFTALGNALAIRAGVAEYPHRLCEKLAGGEFTECSLSMKCFQYDALLMTDREKWRPWVLSEIRRDYGVMLDAGATSVWETIEGAPAFDNAGSLCHGWSAVPILYL